MISRLLAVLLFCSPAVSVAAEGLPTDARLLFNHGAELATSGKFVEATDVLRQTAVVRDKTIAAKALALLGQIAVASAKQCVSENPTETPTEQRQTIFEHLKSAEQSFAESLALQPNEEIRQYLETIRAWRHNITNVWEEYDREQRRNSELQQRIRWLADWEEKLADKVRPIVEESNSPRKFQTEYETSREQKLLANELTKLQDIPVGDEDLREKWAYLPDIQKIADESAELLANHRSDGALPKQQQVLDYLRSLLKQEQNQQNQDQDQNEQEQEQQSQQQNQQQQPNDGSRENDEQKSATGQQQEDPMERVERLLRQAQRKEQAAEQRREQIKALLMQAEPVEKDW
jgi:hypothetical protein